jgi:imidazolonepropionase-like amidohydrolase
MKVRIFLLLVASFFALVSSAQLAAQSPALVTLVKAGRLLDPRTGNVLSPAAVLIENGKIKQVGTPSLVQAETPTGVKTIDLGSATLLPGLIDSHTHLLLDVTVPAEAEIKRRYNGEFMPGLLLAIVESASKRVLLGAQLAREDLESGFTTVRNLGHSGIDGDTALRDAINAGRVSGPRILASGRKLPNKLRTPRSTPDKICTLSGVRGRGACAVGISTHAGPLSDTIGNSFRWGIHWASG